MRADAAIHRWDPSCLRSDPLAVAKLPESGRFARSEAGRVARLRLAGCRLEMRELWGGALALGACSRETSDHPCCVERFSS